MTLRGRYYLAIFSPAALDLVVSVVFVVLAGRPEAILVRLPELALFLVLLNGIGAQRIFAPIAAYLAKPHEDAAALQRIARLPVIAARWCLCVTFAFAMASFVYAPLFRFDVPAEPAVLIVLASRVVIWCTLLPYTVYFLMSDVARRIRLHLFRQHGINLPARDRGIRRKLVLAILGAVFMPVLSITVNTLFVPDQSPITNVSKDVIVAVTFVASLLALASALYALTRALVDPIISLTRSMGLVQAGDLDVRVPVESDDEVGRLSESFNALVEELRHSRQLAARREQERAAVAQQFHEAQKREALGRLAGGIAHDFNNILAIMLGYTEVVQRRLTEPEQKERLGEVMQAGRRAKQLISQILAFSRGEQAGFEPVRLDAALEETVRWLRQMLPANIQLQVDRDMPPLRINANATQISQVLTNLCVNASHAIGPRPGAIGVRLEQTEINGGRAEYLRGLREGNGDSRFVRHSAGGTNGRSCLWLGLLQAGPHGRVDVIDDGSGMSGETLERIFDPYFTTKKVGEGTGLGLAAVLGIVADHQGAIFVETELGVGTRFSIFFPLLAAGDLSIAKEPIDDTHSSA